MKTKEELNALKQEVETLNKKLAELTDEELVQVYAGYMPEPIMPPEKPATPYIPHFCCVNCGYTLYAYDIEQAGCIPDVCPSCGSTADWERY